MTRIFSRQHALALVASLMVVPLAAATVPAAAQASKAPEKDGTVHLDGVSVPISNLMSPEAKAFLRSVIVEKPFAPDANAPKGIKGERANQDRIMNGFLKPMRARYAVNIAEEKIGGVVVDVVTPTNGIAPRNKNRILINVHGGGFSTGARTASLVESVPLAATMGIKVVSIDYRMGPENIFPAASEDVAAVYREILKKYAPSNISLYGCSAGGMLTAQSIAWFQAHKLPNPAAIGVFCASLGQIAVGDSMVTSFPLIGIQLPPPDLRGNADQGPAYFNGTDPKNPLVYPLSSPSVLAKFPPTLFITGTRAMEFSGALNSHNQLAKAGVESQFYAWDGQIHGFFYNSEMPESREAYDIMAKFFDTHMKY